MKPLLVSIAALLICIACTVVAPSQQPSAISQTNLKILPRSSWAKVDRNPQKFEKHSGPINQIVLHHSGAAVHLDGDPRSRINNSIRSWHMEAKGGGGWGDVAYHYLIDAEGVIYEGRPQGIKGRSFTKYDLDRKLLICVLGDYRTLKERGSDLKAVLKRNLTASEMKKTEEDFKKYGSSLSDSSRKSIVQLVAMKVSELNLSLNDVKTHREIAKSTCPGANYQNWFDSAGRKELQTLTRR